VTRTPRPPPMSDPIPSAHRVERLPRPALALTWAQLQRIADDFDFGRLVQMDRPLHSQCNITDPFRTGHGTFVLRARHGEEFVERIEFLHRIMDRLAAAGFPCARVVRSASGASWTRWGDRLVEIHAFIEHDPGIHRGWDRMHAAAAALGELHGALRDAVAGITPVPPEMRNDVSPALCREMLADAVGALNRRRAADPATAARALEICGRASALLEAFGRDYERDVGRLPWTTVHGDFHFWNVLYRGDEVIAIVDFDFLQERERLFDVAYALRYVIEHVRTLAGSAAVDPSRLDWASVRLWIDLYDQNAPFPLTPAERARLPSELLRVFLVALTTAARQDDPARAMCAMSELFDLCAWIAAHPELFA